MFVEHKMALKRPNSHVDKDRDTFLTDFENSCLDGWSRPIPTGKNRFEDPEWAKHILQQVYPYHSDVDWFEYTLFCLNGGGDEWFVRRHETICESM